MAITRKETYSTSALATVVDQRTICGTNPDARTIDDEPIMILNFLKDDGRLATPDLQ